jgi:hypothetical protein
MSSGVLLDGALINLEPARQLIDGDAVDIALDQLFDFARREESVPGAI